MIKKIIFDPFWMLEFYIMIFKSKKKILKLWARKKLIRKYDIHIGMNTSLGNNITFPHPSSIIIGEGVIIDDGCTIYQGVTLGKGDGYPKLEKGVVVFPNSTIINDIVVKENTIVGANSLLLEHTLKDSVYAGNPAKFLRSTKEYTDEK